MDEHLKARLQEGIESIEKLILEHENNCYGNDCGISITACFKVVEFVNDIIKGEITKGGYNE
jgi:hypothetical protein